MSSVHTFKLCNITFWFDYSSEDGSINIQSDGWSDPDFEEPEDLGYGYWFPVDKGEIVWSRFPQNVDLIPEEAREAADEWIQRTIEHE